ncbi:MAG: undecaprenyldiphospho-muramoylpentapeptide beta-N-acetylglucosaminyltransferase [Balneolales bacterium]
MSKYKVLIAAGGTGGHVYPAIAIADALVDTGKDLEINFVGTRDRMEWNAVPKAGYDIHPIWISGFHRRLTFKNLLFPVKLMVSLVQCYFLLKRLKPDVVVSCGGFASGPIGWVAGKLNIPLVLQEQNSFPGVTTRKLGPMAERIFIAFEDAKKNFPADKTELCGNPTRKKITAGDRKQALGDFNFTNKKDKTLLILGGSGGAKTVNEAVFKNLGKLHDDLNLQIIWQCGDIYYDDLHAKIDEKHFENVRLHPFLYEMAHAYAAADLVISRAGALSCAELMLTGKPSILIPSPTVAGDHQTKNAESMVQNGASILLKDKDATESLYDAVKGVITKEEKLRSMSEAAKKLARPDAANVIARQIIELAGQNRERNS